MPTRASGQPDESFKGEEHKSALYEAVFAFEPDERSRTPISGSEDKNLWNPLDECLKGLAVVDPACGSGSFLVGMLHILDDLRERARLPTWA